MPNKNILTRVVVILFIIFFAGLGAYLVKGSKAATLTGDLNGDGTVNVFDLSILLSHWQQTGAGVTGDLNNDQVVNIFDLSILLSQWGQSGSGGSTSAPAYNPPACTKTTDTANYVNDIANATGGAVICLSAGTYPAHAWIGLDKTSMVTIEPSPGATVHLGNIGLTGANNLTFTGFSSLNGSSDSGGLTIQGEYGDLVRNVTWSFNSMATAGVIFSNDPGSNLNILITNNKFVGFTASNEEDRLRLWQDAQDNCAQPWGVTVSYNLFANGESDGTDIDGNTCDAQIVHNVYQNIVEANCGAIHCDPIQDDGGDHGTGTVINGNFFYGADSSGYILQDSSGTGPDIITNNVFGGGSGASCQEGEYNVGSVEDHNTWDCSSLQGVAFYGDSSNPSTNIEMQNNVFRSDGYIKWVGANSGPCGSYCSWKTGSPDYNLHTAGVYGGLGGASDAGAGGHDVIGTPIFAGGASPSTWTGYRLSGSSINPSTPPLGSDGKVLGADTSITPGPSW